MRQAYLLFYQRADTGLPMVARLTPFSRPAGLDDALASLGWHRQDDTQVMVAPQCPADGEPLPDGAYPGTCRRLSDDERRRVPGERRHARWRRGYQHQRKDGEPAEQAPFLSGIQRSPRFCLRLGGRPKWRKVSGLPSSGKADQPLRIDTQKNFGIAVGLIISVAIGIEQ